ncbi:MAG: hypothetical protein K2Q18_01835, partial [Bdellovibrionales bacterium]|nr:hypothetical protein [Bdellovibrionales bacterium]
MKSITRSVLVLLFSLTLLQAAYAETTKTFKFENQREEIVDLVNWLKRIDYKKEEVDSTCYRQEPYVENVCRDVTRYRQECHVEPSHEECGTVYDQVCRTETSSERECHTERGGEECRVVVNYREECSSVGGGQECRTVPGDIECSIVNGENRCVKIPPHEECSDAPSR